MKDADIYKTIGRRIRDTREEMDMTQEELSRFLHVTTSTIVDIEKGRRKVTIPELQTLAIVFNAPLAWFLTGEDATPKTRPEPRELPEEAKKEITTFLNYIWQKYGTKDEAR